MIKFLKRSLTIFLVPVIFLFTACSIVPPQNSDVAHQIDSALSNSIQTNQNVKPNNQTNLPSFVDTALSPSLAMDLPKPNAQEQRFDVVVNHVPAASFFTGLVKGTQYSVMVDPSVTGNITLDLKDVTIEEALQAVRDSYGYQYEREPYGYHIFPSTLETRIFTVNYLDIDRKGKSETIVNSGQITRTIQGESSNRLITTPTTTAENIRPTSSIETSSDTNFWKSLKDTLTAIIGDKDGHLVVINPQAGLVIVKAYPDELHRVAQYLDSIQNIMERQVILEAKVLEVELNAQYQAGIDWRILGLVQTGTVNKDINDEISQFANIFRIHASAGKSFWAVIQLLNSQGRVNVLSSPRIATTNNQKAIIKVGDDHFFVTNVESTTTTAGTALDTNQNIELTPFFSGIALDVTPEVGQDGMVTLHIHPVVSTVVEERKKFKVNNQEQDLPLAQSSVRESDSVVRAQNGEVIVIGGLMENGSADYEASVPGADKLPGIRDLFKSTNRSSRKFELVILLRPIVVEPEKSAQIWTQRINEAQRVANGTRGDFRYTPDFKPKEERKNK
ncbi:MAG: pilus (MSHA type) biogenesis protein MshL [Gammaproteobacteria bacterium]|nr:pilus (MSHA type) biogenesis protein MshL [Gammaproteobacteria bacterium]